MPFISSIHTTPYVRSAEPPLLFIAFALFGWNGKGLWEPGKNQGSGTNASGRNIVPDVDFVVTMVRRAIHFFVKG